MPNDLAAQLEMNHHCLLSRSGESETVLGLFRRPFFSIQCGQEKNAHLDALVTV